MDIDAVKRAAGSEADADGMVKVVAVLDGVKDNGKTYAKLARFRMHRDLVPAHVMAGQVGIDGDAALPKAKQQPTPRDKQQRGGADK